MRDVIWPNRLRNLRTATHRRYGQSALLDDVAKIVGCTVSYLSKLERGRQRPDRAMLEKLADHYGVSADTIALGEARVEIDELKVVGAWCRVRRKAQGLSIDAMAKFMGVSASQIRLVEAGQRPFEPEDRLTNDLARFFGLSNARELSSAAAESELDEEVQAALRSLHPTALTVALHQGFRLSDRHPVEIPPHVQSYLRPGLHALLVDNETRFGGVLDGAFIIIDPSGPPATGLMEAGGQVYKVDDGICQDGEPAQRFEGRASTVVLIVPPKNV